MKDINTVPMDPATARAEMQYLYEQGRNSVREVHEAGKPEIFEVNDQKYFFSNGKFQRVEPVKPEKEVKPDTFCAFSLDGLIDFIKADVDEFFKDERMKCIVQVSSPTEVNVYTPVIGYWRERQLLARCQATVPNIRFGSWMDPEEFQIMLLSTFHPNENRASALKVAGNLRKEQNITVGDDGTSQRITVNQGVATAANVTIENPVYLIPMRTFPEVEQPESPFVLRFNNDANVALFSGDGGAWKLEAVARITEYLRNNLAGYNVVVIG